MNSYRCGDFRQDFMVNFPRIMHRDSASACTGDAVGTTTTSWPLCRGCVASILTWQRQLALTADPGSTMMWRAGAGW